MAKFREHDVVEFDASQLGYRVVVVVPTCESLPHLEACLRSLENQTVVELTIAVSDFGSDDGTVEYIRRHHPRVKVFHHEGPSGHIARAVNRTLDEVNEAPFVAVVYPDTQLKYDVFVRMVKRLLDDDDAGIAVPRLMNADEPDKTVCTGVAVTTSFEPVPLKWTSSPVEDPDEPIHVTAGRANCMLIRRDVFDIIGGFDEDFLYNWHDVEFCLRACISGVKCLLVPDALAYVKSRSETDPWSVTQVVHLCRGALPAAVKLLPPWDLFWQFPVLLLNRLKVAGLFACGGRLGAALQGEAAAISLLARMWMKRRRLPKPTDDGLLDDLLSEGNHLKEIDPS